VRNYLQNMLKRFGGKRRRAAEPGPSSGPNQPGEKEANELNRQARKEKQQKWFAERRRKEQEAAEKPPPPPDVSPP
jgi:hypothetical protein